MTTLLRAAKNAAAHGGKVQTAVRDYLADPEMTMDGRLSAICSEVEAFKTWAEDHHIDNDPEKRKAVNNIINDISRICRKQEGVSIVCTQRKGGYVYEAKTVTPKTSISPVFGRATGEVTTFTEFIEQNPYTSLRIVLDTLTPTEFMNAVKNHQAEDTEENKG